MAKALIFVLLLLGSTAVFRRVAEWFEDVKILTLPPLRSLKWWL